MLAALRHRRKKRNKMRPRLRPRSPPLLRRPDAGVAIHLLSRECTAVRIRSSTPGASGAAQP